MQYSQPLPSALLGDKNALSPEGRKELDSLSCRSPRAFMTQLIITWITIVMIIALAVKLDTIWMSLVTIFVVATRQNILGLLIHEQAHCLGFKSMPGDILVNLFAAYPVIEPQWLGKIILPNLNFNLHPYHHFCPGIPFNNLPKAHAIFRREGLINEQNVFKGYRAYFQYLVRCP